MVTRTYLVRLLAYGEWADRRLLGYLTDDAPLEAKRLFEHALAAQETWLNRIRQTPADIPLWGEPRPDTWQSRIESLAVDWSAALEEHDDPQTLIRYKNTKGVAFATALHDIVTHLAIHGQHHRAQVLSALRRAGIVPPQIDFIVFAREEPVPS